MRNWFNTAPKIKSDKVLNIEKIGRSALIIEAIEDAKNNSKNGGKHEGYSKCKSIFIKLAK